jgi:Universal stress protein family
MSKQPTGRSARANSIGPRGGRTSWRRRSRGLRAPRPTNRDRPMGRSWVWLSNGLDEDAIEHATGHRLDNRGHSSTRAASVLQPRRRSCDDGHTLDPCGSQTIGRPATRIVVGVDGSDASYDALRWARREALAHQGSLAVVCAWAYPIMGTLPLPDESQLTDILPENSRHVVRTMLDRVEAEQGGDVETHPTVAKAAPAAALLSPDPPMNRACWH